MKPTKEEQQWLWERCNFPIEKSAYGQYPPIDLNNLFKYAVPAALKIFAERGYIPPIMKLFQLWYDELVTIGGDSSDIQWAAIALFGVIYKALEVTDEKD